MIETEKDPDMREMAKQEIKNLEEKKEALTGKLKLMLIPKDPLRQEEHHHGDSRRNRR